MLCSASESSTCCWGTVLGSVMSTRIVEQALIYILDFSMFVHTLQKPQCDFPRAGQSKSTLFSRVLDFSSTAKMGLPMWPGIENREDFPKSGFSDTRESDFAFRCERRLFNVHREILRTKRGYLELFCNPRKPFGVCQFPSHHLEVC